MRLGAKALFLQGSFFNGFRIGYTRDRAEVRLLGIDIEKARYRQGGND